MSNNHRSPFLTIVIIAVIILITVAIILWFKPNNSSAASTHLASTTTDRQVTDSLLESTKSNKISDALAARNSTGFITGLENLPRSLQGTTVDGEIIIDEHQQLVVTEGLRRLFDYFLSALGEEEEAIIYARVESYIRTHTPEPAASQAVAIFDQYVAYLKALPEIEKRYGNLQMQATENGQLDLDMVAQQKQDVARLRQQHFSEETISAFFGAQEDYDNYSIEMIKINQNEQLTDVQKDAARQDYISRMPNNLTKANIKQQANLNELISRTEQMKAKGATAEALYNMRRELVGAPAAARLALVDQEEASFEQRFNQYQAQKQQLLGQNTNTAQVQIDQLETQFFNEEERKRLTGYAALQQQKAILTN